MNVPLVSVVVPVFNGERYLRSAIESVIVQDYRPVEIIVVDDGSTDRSSEIIQSFGAEVQLVTQPNHGVAAARNAGVAAASGEFLAFLDQDDLWTSDKLTLQVRYLQEHRQTPAVLSRVRMFLEPGIKSPAWIPDRYLEQDLTAYLLGALIVRKSAFEKVGHFDVGFQHASDHDWFARYREIVGPLPILPKTLLMVRIHDENQSARVQAIIREALSLVRSSIHRKRRDIP